MKTCMLPEPLVADKHHWPKVICTLTLEKRTKSGDCYYTYFEFYYLGKLWSCAYWYDSSSHLLRTEIWNKSANYFYFEFPTLRANSNKPFINPRAL